MSCNSQQNLILNIAGKLITKKNNNKKLVKMHLNFTEYIPFQDFITELKCQRPHEKPRIRA